MTVINLIVMSSQRRAVTDQEAPGQGRWPKGLKQALSLGSGEKQVV